jgi:hypothetical protein
MGCEAHRREVDGWRLALTLAAMTISKDYRGGGIGAVGGVPAGLALGSDLLIA